MRRLRKLSYRRWLRGRNVAEQIKEFDRDPQFLVKKFAHVRHAAASTSEKNALRHAPLLLRAIATDGAHQLRVQSRHRAARYFRVPRYNLGSCLLICVQ